MIVQHDIGIFWDYENVRVPQWCQAADASNAIRDAVQGLGHIVERRLYHQMQGNVDHTNVKLAGFTLVHCPWHRVSNST